VLWSHRLLLAAVSPFLRRLLLDSEDDAVLTIHLPQVAKEHLRLVLDYVYTGAMYLCADQLAAVVRVFEMLRMKCGVSVSKMVAVETTAAKGKRSRQKKVCATKKWVEEAEFEGFEDIKSELVEDEAAAAAQSSSTTTQAATDSLLVLDAAEELERETETEMEEAETAEVEEEALEAVEEMEDNEPPVVVRPLSTSADKEEKRRLNRGTGINLCRKTALSGS
jgi:hypothetical protein